MNSLKKLSTFTNSMPTNNCNVVKEAAKVQNSTLENESKSKSDSEFKGDITSNDVPMLLNGDENFDNSESHFLNNQRTNKEEKEDNDIPLLSVNNEVEIKPLGDISVSLENIKPGTTFF